MKMITTLDQLSEAILANEIPALQGVPSPIIKEFMANLRFSGGALAHAEYAMLQKHVPAARLPELFSHFGISEKEFGDIKDTSCVDHVCFVHPHAFCREEYCRH
jgi:hypothetical protein